MTTNPPEAPPGPHGPSDGPAGPHNPPPSPDVGPRVSRDEIRDLGALRRVRGERKLAGVAGGIARHFDIDPLIPRVALVVLALFGGVGLLFYGVCWLIVPAEGSSEATVRLDARSRAVALVIVGALSALALVGDSFGGWGFPWPLALVGAVLIVVMLARGGRDPKREPGAPVPTYPHGPADPARAVGRVETTPRPLERRRGPILFWYALAIIAIGLGVLGIVDAAGGPVTPSAYPAFALGTCGALLVLGAFWGRAGGLVLLGLVAAVATAGFTVGEQIDAGQVDARPTTSASVQDRYAMDAGEIVLDLTDVGDLANLDGRSIELELDIGHIKVIVPRGLDAVADARVDVGHRNLFGDNGDGNGTASSRGRPDAPQITLDARVTFGEIEIIREGASR